MGKAKRHDDRVRLKKDTASEREKKCQISLMSDPLKSDGHSGNRHSLM